MLQTLRDSFAMGRYSKQVCLTNCDEGQLGNPIGSRMMKVNALPAHAFGRLQSASGDAAKVAVYF